MRETMFARTSMKHSSKVKEQDMHLSDFLRHCLVDVLLAPTCPVTATLLSEVAAEDALTSYAKDVFTVPASLAGLAMWDKRRFH